MSNKTPENFILNNRSRSFFDFLFIYVDSTPFRKSLESGEHKVLQNMFCVNSKFKLHNGSTASPIYRYICRLPVQVSSTGRNIRSKGLVNIFGGLHNIIFEIRQGNEEKILVRHFFTVFGEKNGLEKKVGQNMFFFVFLRDRCQICFLILSELTSIPPEIIMEPMVF